MAIEQFAPQTVLLFNGLSSDIKPTQGIDNTTRAEFSETDTGNVFVWTGSAWVRVGTNGAGHVTNVVPTQDATVSEVLASAARTATPTIADQANLNARGVHLVIDVTVAPAAASVVPKIQGKDPVSGNYYDILEGLPITTVGTNVMKVYPNISAFISGSASDLIPQTWRVVMTHADADSITYSVAALMLA